MSAGPPVPSGEPLQLFQILMKRFLGCVLILLHQFVQVFRKDRPNRVQSVVPAQALGSKAGQGVYHCPLSKGNLILDDDVNDRVKFRIRQRDVIAMMVSGDKLDALRFVGVKPVNRGRRRLGIV
jgi:hypothetical protein